jgi:glycerol transport system ATP-binding protein
LAHANFSAGLELQGIHKLVQQERHLTEVDLHCPPGSFTVLLGRVRAGKTSLLRIIAGLDRPSSGHVFWNGGDVTRHDVRTRDVAMVYQQFVNYPSLTVYENIASPLRAGTRRGMSRAEVDRRVRETARRLGIEQLLQRLPAALSGGQQQRTAIARALAKEANLVLLDEPLANLDYKLREELRSELRSFFTRHEISVVYATAEPHEALWLGGTTAVLDEGRVLQCGPAAEVYARPETERVARVFSDPEINLFDVEVAETQIHALQHPALSFRRTGLLARLPLGPLRFGVRAHDVQRKRRSDDAACVSALVTLEEVSGSETLLRAESGTLQWTAQTQGTHRHAVGTRSPIELFIEPQHVLAFDRQGRALPAVGARAHARAH